jgi:hypothetical protein
VSSKNSILIAIIEVSGILQVQHEIEKQGVFMKRVASGEPFLSPVSYKAVH